MLKEALHNLQLNELETNLDKIYITVEEAIEKDPQSFYHMTIKGKEVKSPSDIINSIDELISTFVLACVTSNNDENIEDFSEEELSNFGADVKRMLHDFKRDADVPLANLVASYNKLIKQQETPEIINILLDYDRKFKMNTSYTLSSAINSFIWSLLAVVRPRDNVYASLTNLGNKIRKHVQSNLEKIVNPDELVIIRDDLID